MIIDWKFLIASIVVAFIFATTIVLGGQALLF